MPTAGLLHALLGKASWGLGRLEAGDEYFRRALELDPHNMVTIEYVAVAHFRRKRYRQALDLFRTLFGDRSRKGSDSRPHRRNPALPGPNGRSNPEPGTSALPGPNPGNGQNQPGGDAEEGAGIGEVAASAQKELSTKESTKNREGVKRFIHEKAKTYPRRATKKGKGPLRGWRKIQRGAPRVGKGEEDIHEGGIGGKSYPRRNTKGSAKGLEENPEGSAMGRE